MTGIIERRSRRGRVLLTVPRTPISLPVSRASFVLTAITGGLAVLVAAVSLTLGVLDVDARGVGTILAGGGTLIERDVVLGDRLPRAFVGLGVGAAFGLSGAILQRVALNPLVSPDIVGINSGAGFGALLVILVLGGSGFQVVVGALLGAGLTGISIVLIAYRRGLHGFRLVLVGVGMAAILSSATSYLLTQSDIHKAMSAAAWLSGSLANRNATHVIMIATGLAVAVPVVMIGSRHLRALDLGDDLARTLTGTGRGRTALLVLTAVGLAGIATAAAGPIAFVALVSPHIARRLLTVRQVGLAPAAAIGALLLVSADLASRLLFAPSELPVGIFTAVLGAPALLYLLARANRMGAAG